MSIKNYFTKDELRRLLILVYLGEWMVTAYHDADENAEYTEVFEKILHLAQQMGFDEYVEWLDTPRTAAPTAHIEAEGQKFLEEYEEKFFLAELANRFSQIDVEALIRNQKKV